MFQRTVMLVGSVTCALVAGACQDNVTTDFPPGLEPLEDNLVPVPQGGAVTETLVMVSGGDEHKWVHGRAYLLADPGVVWAATKDPEVVAVDCDTDRHMATLGVEPDYEYGFQMHYEVDDILTVAWDELWRYGTVTGTPAAPELAMIRYQKVSGSDFITTLEGSMMFKVWEQPGVTEIELIEHLTAVGGDIDNIKRSMQHHYDNLKADVHGTARPGC